MYWSSSPRRRSVACASGKRGQLADLPPVGWSGPVAKAWVSAMSVMITISNRIPGGDAGIKQEEFRRCEIGEQ